MYGILNQLTKPSGYSVETGPYGEMVVRSLFSCCHCGFTWEAPSDSVGGQQAGGFCGKCVGFLCRNPDCLKECVPFERRLENEEAGKPRLTPGPARVVVPELYTGE